MTLRVNIHAVWRIQADWLRAFIYLLRHVFICGSDLFFKNGAFLAEACVADATAWTVASRNFPSSFGTTTVPQATGRRATCHSPRQSRDLMINIMDLWRILGCGTSNGSLMVGTIVKPKLGLGPGRSARRPCLLVARRLHLEGQPQFGGGAMG